LYLDQSVRSHAAATWSGWASVNPQAGKPVSEVVAAYLRSEKTIKIKRANRVTLNGVGENPGIAEEG
jgi:sulfur-oxidizing protein SoxB